jgi:hypothetical protein
LEEVLQAEVQVVAVTVEQVALVAVAVAVLVEPTHQVLLVA